MHQGELMAYNPWYTDTYEPILNIANWDSFADDAPKKMVAIFSWMPQTIMSIRHPGKQFKYQLFELKSLIDALKKSENNFDLLKFSTLLSVDITLHQNKIEELFSALFHIMGAVATSKYLHFSAPRLFPMWDRQIRVKGGFSEDSSGYFAYMSKFKSDLQIESNLEKAKQKYPANPIRGWDIVSMESR
jgi:hypothetical protein